MFLLAKVLVDTPANCAQDKLIGTWEIQFSSEIFAPVSDQVKCPKKFNVTKTKQTVTLIERGVAITNQGKVRSGTWTAVSNQGFEIRFGGKVFFLFSQYDENNTKISHCNKAIGWAHAQELKTKKFRCITAELVKPKVSLIEPISNLFKNSFSTPKSKNNENYNQPTGHNLWVGSNLPVNFSWRNVNGKSYLPAVYDQKSCGSCYAVASVQAMTSRVMVASNLTDPLGITKKLSVQHIVDCNQYTQGCDGGFGEEVSKFSEDFGILTEDNYQGYQAEAKDCSANLKQYNKNDQRYHFTGQRYLGGYFGAETSAEAMQWELYRYGAFPVSVFVDPKRLVDGQEYAGDFKNCMRKTNYPQILPNVPIYPELTNEQIVNGDGRRHYLKKTNHLVLLTGWGTDAEGDYWEIMNSWGEKFCDQGFIRISRGTNEYNVESSPIVFYWAGHNVSSDSADDVVMSQAGYITVIFFCILFAISSIGLGVTLLYQKRAAKYIQVEN